MAHGAFDVLRRGFEDPRCYPSLPRDARVLYVMGSQFGRGSFGIFRLPTARPSARERQSSMAEAVTGVAVGRLDLEPRTQSASIEQRREGV